MERERENGAYGGRVMTEEQMEILRKQIAVYAAICEQLVLLHNSLSSFDTLSSGTGGGGYMETLVMCQRAASGRQRWTPTAGQLERLESIYEEGNGTPNRQRIKEIAEELSELGHITHTNVYNWFQNRRARSKRKPPKPAPEKEDSGGGASESYHHILFPSPDLGIEHLLGKAEGTGEPSSFGHTQD